MAGAHVMRLGKWKVEVGETEKVPLMKGYVKMFAFYPKHSHL